MGKPLPSHCSHMSALPPSSGGSDVVVVEEVVLVDVVVSGSVVVGVVVGGSVVVGVGVGGSVVVGAVVVLGSGAWQSCSPLGQGTHCQYQMLSGRQ